MIFSEQFDDIYFSQDNGLAETAHVFLQGNRLPQAWYHRSHFTIAETGFGTGLNFLSAWKLFEETSEPGATLDYISFEKYPLAPGQIQGALTQWADYFGGWLEAMLAAYPLRVNGFHRVHVSARVRLTLIFDDVNEALPELIVPCCVNAWFLDGFAPAKNPEMWSETLFCEMARLSAPGATVASFTAAGVVRRGLAAQGFAVTKARGYGRKRDMTLAVYRGESKTVTAKVPSCVAVIGGGLAGTTCAYTLKRRGVEAVIFDPQGLAQFASGNPLGIYNPRFSQLRSGESCFYTSGFAALAALNQPSQRCGSLHLITSDEKRKRFQGMLDHWGWHHDHAHILSAQEAGEKAGVPLAYEALYLPDSGYISPQTMCSFYAEGIEVRAGQYDPREFDGVILANGIQAKDHEGLSDLPIHTVRGQISYVEPVDALPVKTNLCFGGYLSASNSHGMMAGSTFQPWRTDIDVTEEDHRDILGKLYETVPALAAQLRVTGGRAALRCAAKDRFPVIGPVADSPGLYVSTAHGSHGLISSLAGAEYLADVICQTPVSLSRAAVAALDPARFALRQSKRDCQRADLRG